MKFMKFLKKYLLNVGYMFRYSWKIAKSGYLLLIIKSIITTVQPFALLIIPKYILDELTVGRRWNITLFYVLLYIAVLAFTTISGTLIGYFEKIIISKIQLKNTLVYEDFLLCLDYEKLEDSAFREWGAEIQNNVDAWNFINNTVCNFLINLIQLIGYAYIIVSIHPLIICVILIAIFLFSQLSKKGGKINLEYQPILVRFSRRFTYLYNTMISFEHGKDIRINKASDWLEKKYEKETNDYMEKYVENQKKNFWVEFLKAIIDFFQTLIVYGYCAYSVMIGNITLGSFTMFLGAITAFTYSLTSFTDKCVQLKYFSHYVDEYRKYTKETIPTNAEKETVDISEIDTEMHEIEFVNVSFKYPNTNRYVLKNVNIVIRSGERLSIVGYNGSGKSTFIKLICRLYYPTEGKILYNGIDISTIKKDQYREQISVVFQDFKLFSMSLRENVILNRTEDETRLYEAIEKSGLLNKVSTLKKGINTLIYRDFDYDGLEFSGGEGQKLDCARAYYKDAPVVILDEPTASLDPIAESQLYERFNSIIGKKTAIYISHRLASVKFCDVIAVFVDGEIIEYGTHKELLALSGVYSDMFKKQAEHYIHGEES